MNTASVLAILGLVSILGMSVMSSGEIKKGGKTRHRKHSSHYKKTKRHH